MFVVLLVIDPTSHELGSPANPERFSVASAINAQDFQAVAKVFGTGRNRFMGWLRERSFLQANNRPYQRYEDAGYFRVIERKRKDPQTGEDITYTKTLVTGKGLTYLHKKWQEDHPSSQGESA